MWTWISGDTLNNALGRFGAKGIPNPANVPPSLYEAFEWKGTDGNFWLYGGVCGTGVYSALWRYSPVDNEWTWMSGDSTVNDGGHYGIQGVPSVLNRPPCRSYGGCSWVDLDGNFWLFGGGSTGSYNDLWKYDVLNGEWAFMKGTSTMSDPGNYGIQGVPASTNLPRSRQETAAAWTDINGDLWMFGGTDDNEGCLNDLWRFNIASNMWTWMKGSAMENADDVYGIRGIEDSLNTPGGRWVYSRWRDSVGNFWLFAGSQMTPSSARDHNDLWRYNPTTNIWTWINGDSTGFAYSVHGSKCDTGEAYKPGSVLENRASWTDLRGNFWTFMDFSYGNSLWMYEPKLNRWTFESGDSLNPLGIYGTRGITNENNIPPELEGAIGWSDDKENLYLFGGDCGGRILNTLWRYSIDSACAHIPAITSGVNLLKVEPVFSLFPNPATKNFTIAFETPTQSLSVKVCTNVGQEVFSEKIANDLMSKDFSFQFPAGIYMVTLTDGEHRSTKKLIIQ